MASQSPFSWLEGLLQSLPFSDLQPPAWAVDEAQRRIVLLLNHILMQEPEACSRLVRQKGRVMQLQWRAFSIRLAATNAGLLDLAAHDAKPDLLLELSEASPLVLAQGLLRGERPLVRVAGDVQFAAEINWLVDHVRWEMEEDLARVVGDAAAYTLAQAGQAVVKALRQFIDASVTSSPDKAST